jgi:hypothetical protein
VRCGQLGPVSVGEPLEEHEKFIVVPDGDPRLELIPSQVICVDFDSTVCKHAYPNVGENVEGAFEVLRQLQKYGHKIILHTMREHVALGGVPDILQVAIDKMKSEGINLYSVNSFPQEDTDWHPSRKVYADVYIDDHNIMIPKKSDGYIDWAVLDKWFVENHYYLGNAVNDG